MKILNYITPKQIFQHYSVAIASWMQGIRNFKKCKEVNKRKNNYYNEHRKLLLPILEKTKKMTEQDGEEYV